MNRSTAQAVLMLVVVTVLAIWRIEGTSGTKLRWKKTVGQVRSSSRANPSSDTFGNEVLPDVPRQVPVRMAASGQDTGLDGPVARQLQKRRLAGLALQLQAIEAENLEVVQEYEGPGSLGIYAFAAPNDEQINRMNEVSNRFADGLNEAERAALQTRAQQLIGEYANYPAPYKTLLVGYSPTNKNLFLTKTFSDTLPAPDDQGSLTLGSGKGSTLTVTGGPFSTDEGAGQLYGDYLPLIEEDE